MPSNLRRATLAAAAVLLLAAPELEAQRLPLEHEGVAATGLHARRLGVSKRVLMVAAHPDDESTQILARLALGDGADVAYLSLTRGEGGQNLIGPELDEALGILRSEELLAARRLDGARQYFTRAIDFGFVRSADETFEQWPREEILRDAVAVIRHFRPDIVVSIFTGTTRDGHGQHQVAGMIAREAFDAAADPARFPDQIARGLAPHAAHRYYQSSWRVQEGEGFTIETGTFDPLLGRSWFQIAMASRSRHRSQDMGRVLPLGPQQSRVQLIHDRLVPNAGQPASFFAGMDTTLLQRAARLNAPRDVLRSLAGYDSAAARVRASLLALDPSPAVPHLVTALARLRAAESALPTAPYAAAPASASSSGPRAASPADLRFYIDEERRDAEAALAAAAAVVVEAFVGVETATPGETVQLELAVWNGGTRPVTLARLEPVLPAGWTLVELEAGDGAQLAPGQLVVRRGRVLIPADAHASEPYYLRQPRAGAFYDWNATAPDAPGLAFEPAPIHVRAQLAVQGEAVTIEREAVFRDADKSFGEFRRPFRVVPRFTVATTPGAGVVRTGRAPTPMTFDVRVFAETPGPASGTLTFAAPQGWRVQPASAPLRFEERGQETTTRFTVTPPASLADGRYRLEAVFREEGGAVHRRSYTLVDYDHVRPRALFTDAVAPVRALAVNVPQRVRVGYITGAGDDVADALERLGLAVTRIAHGALAGTDLNAFDVLVMGIRTYEVRADLPAQNRRLLDWVERGGTLIVQYNKYELVDGNFTPYPMTMARPHGRITHADAPVRLLQPDHPVLARPNRIGVADFEGWVQERGLYFANTWDDRFQALLEMQDSGQPAQQGALLVAPYGRGTYVYTGLALFRQVSEGVPGAYRLLANLVALGERR
jgi:LmbE family N-acetylglucosaminyl deacetylase